MYKHKFLVCVQVYSNKPDFTHY